MIRKTMAFAMFSLFSVAVMASTKTVVSGNINASPAQKENRQLTADTIMVPTYAGNPLTGYQNWLFKKRLDSVQKSVQLDYNNYVQNYIDIYLNRPEQMGRMVGLSKYYFPIFEKALKENNVPEEIKYLSIVESALDPNAVSRVGATGPWQFMFTTAKAYGLTIDNFVDE